jgi:hypothetical protein
MMADNGAPLEAVTAPARPPCPTLPCPALPCPALPTTPRCAAYHRHRDDHPHLLTSSPLDPHSTTKKPPRFQLPSLPRAASIHRSIVRSITALPYLGPPSQAGSSPQFCADLQNRTSYKSHREDRVSRESFFVCF